jgi:hypothetical protein
VGAVFGTLATLVRLVCGSCALVLAAFVLCAVGQANPNNWLVSSVGSWAAQIHLGLTGLFPVASPDARIIADFGVPALAWMAIGWFVGKLLRSL